MKLLLYFLLSLMCTGQASNTHTKRIYKFEHASNGNKGQVDYIQLVFEKDSIKGGKYYGNENNIHFVADIEFNEDIQCDYLVFTLNNYVFCDNDSNPYQRVACLQKDNPEFDVLLDMPRFRGDISSGQLILNRIFDYYSGRFDDMTFTLVNGN
ncbi:hypothetical protein GN157_05065 [Flavobacterium rakeshii]|uniref:Uncharacterized protein n=1 Tax=Flavobacterium rakeshii TaxID=1038845 RepID=A0A6N8H929_9FLAO|nr:hypothetical protein [Flavobacterium rakeshii]MUV03074.1 hypothetical protein [Flavobacterium rakeshii]